MRARRRGNSGAGSQPPDWCPPWENNFSVWDFAGSGANVFKTRIGGRSLRSSASEDRAAWYWVLDARTGELLWARLVRPRDHPGGIQWGTAIDGKRIYAAIGHNQNAVPYTLPSGDTITGGSVGGTRPDEWTNPVADSRPVNAPDLAALTVANGVLHGGSMAHTGDRDVRARHEDWPHPLAIRSRRLGRRRPCGRRRNGVLGLRRMPARAAFFGNKIFAFTLNGR